MTQNKRNREREGKREKRNIESAFNILCHFEHRKRLCKKTKFTARISNRINDNPDFLFITFLLLCVTLFPTILCTRHFGPTN